MTDEIRILVQPILPPMSLADVQSLRMRQTDPLPRLGRLACCLTALALPAFGLAATVKPRPVGTPDAVRAAAPVSPSAEAAVRATRTSRRVRVARLEQSPTDGDR